MLRVIGAGLLLAAGVAEGALEIAQLKHMPQAGIGWFWDTYNSAPFAWWPLPLIGHVALAAGILVGWRPALARGSLLGALFTAIWVWLTTYYGSKISRLDDPEPYLVLIPLLFVIAYAAVTLACLRAVRRADGVTLAE